jgi:hypothetical protein
VRGWAVLKRNHAKVWALLIIFIWVVACVLAVKGVPVFEPIATAPDSGAMTAVTDLPDLAKIEHLDCSGWFQDRKESFGYLVRYRKIDAGNDEGYLFTLANKMEIKQLRTGVYEFGIRKIRRSDCMFSAEALDTLAIHGRKNQQFEQQEPPAFALMAPYPNPASRHITIPLFLESRMAIKLGLYDVAGREVTVFYGGEWGAGSSVITCIVGDVAPGVYFVRLEYEGRVASQKVVIVR